MYTEFIEVNQRQLFACWSHQQRKTDCVTLLLPPFAEEMNKSRHLLKQLRQQLDGSCDVLLLDPAGTGDSSGDLDTSNARDWTSDWLSIISKLKNDGYQGFHVVALRFGALQLFDILQYELALPLHKIVLWQPYLQTGIFLQQFFRLKIAEQMANGQKTSQKELEQQLANGNVVEVAGYPITPNFVSSVQALQDIDALPAAYQQTPLLWLETSMMPNVSPVSEKGMAVLSQHFAAEFQQLQGASWWNTNELVQTPELIARTVEFLTGKSV